MSAALTNTSTTTPAGRVQPCWSTAGVWGECNCVELFKFIHCRNCPAYSAAAAALLDGKPPEGYVEGWTGHFAAPKASPEQDTQSFLIFRINASWMALPSEVLVEIVERRTVHSLPHARSPFVKGIVNIRGQLLICVSLTRLLHLTERTVEQKNSETIFERLLLVNSAQGRLVFPVSEVSGVLRCRPADLREPPATVSRASVHFTKALLPWKNSRRAGKAVASEDVTVAILDQGLLFHAINGGLS